MDASPVSSTVLDSSAAAGVAARRPRRDTSLAGILLSLGGVALKVAGLYVALLAVITAIHFPYQTDEPNPHRAPDANQNYYTGVYAGGSGDAAAASAAPAAAVPTEAESKYVELAKKAIEVEGIKPRISGFVAKYGLGRGKRVLDVGAGTGYLQDMAEDYVGLDISPSAARYFHKPFVAASATQMPFRDNEFDAAWSIWVLEHVPKPEQALSEIRRVVKDGGLLYLKPAWGCPWWLAQGYEVRPYSDLNFTGKVKKASLNLLASPYYRGAALIPSRWLRKTYAEWSGQPTRFHYTLLEPNYQDYWVADSDAINNLDYHEMLLWFTSRGDECLNCAAEPIWDAEDLVLRVHKKKGS